MKTIFNYDTVSIALRKLEEKGYSLDFNVDFEQIYKQKDDFTIDYLYRYEGASNPSDESTVYGLRNLITGDKGVFVVGDLALVEGKKRDIIIKLEIRAKHSDDL